MTDQAEIPAESPAAAENQPRLRRARWLVLALVAAIVAFVPLFLAADWCYRQWLAPSVDPAWTAGATIRPGNAAGGSGGEDRSVADAALSGRLEGLSQAAIDAAPHPLDPVLEVARRARDSIRSEIRDYTAIMINRVRLDDGRLREEQHMFLKVRHARDGDGTEVPFSVYTRFLKPRSMQGQEAIWIEGRNDNKLVGHPPGLLNLTRVWLEPDGPIAMRGNRYPMWDLGILKLLDKMIEKGERDRQHGPCEVRLDMGAAINDAPCVMIEVRHPEKREPFDFHIARIYIDLASQLPVAYEGFLWPEKPGTEPVLLESYIYQQILPNPGLTDADFDPDNRAYNFPGG